MTVKDKNNAELRVGDIVYIAAKVRKVYDGDGPGNIEIDTVEKIAGGHPATFHTSGALVERAETDENDEGDG